jgi:WD40-like Beta Propeller Repeat
MGRDVFVVLAVLTAWGVIGASSTVAADPVEDHLYYSSGGSIRAEDLSTSTTRSVKATDSLFYEASVMAVSPDGQAVVFSNSASFGSTIAVVTNDGEDYEHLLNFNHDGGYFRFPKFAADNRHILVNRQDQEDDGDDIYLLSRNSRADNPSVSALITWDGDQYDGVFSPDGDTLYFASNTAPNGDPLDGFTIYSADADGTNATLVPGLTGIEDVWGVQVSPNGNRLIFGGLAVGGSDYDIYSVGVNGSGLAQLTDTPNDGEFYPMWSPDGQKIAFIRNSGVGTVADADGTDDYAVSGDWPTFRQPSDFVSMGDIQAAKFRPQWQFDDSENWRPLNVDMFMAERDPTAPTSAFHRMCNVLGCDPTPLSSASDVEGWTDSWVDVGSIGGGDPDDFYSPRAGCAVNGLRDCDGADKTGLNFNAAAVYYNATSSPGAYRYLDYWTFYRYNDLSIDEHEGDWEGATVVPSLTNPEAIDAVGMAQHTSLIWYLPGSLDCDAGGSGSCEPGTRPWVYVASGSHASYSSSCENQVLPPQVCLTPDNAPEGDHKGDAPWGRNDDDPGSGALLEFPAAGGNWVDWAGHWGNGCAPVFDCLFTSPSSPGVQHRFACPWDGFEQELCPGGSQALSAVTAADHADSATACGNWVAPDLAATACSPTMLRAAIAGGALGGAGSFEVTRQGGRSASAKGVAQLSDGLLAPGDRVWVSGRAPDDTQLIVRAIDGYRLYEARFENLGLRGGGKVRVDVRRHDGGVVFRAGTQGRKILPIERRAHSAEADRAAGGAPNR